MELYRIAHERFVADLSGTGARLYGGRWNSEGQAAVYTASSRALALLETLVHTPLHLLQHQKFVLVTLKIPEPATIEKIDRANLPTGWNLWDYKQHTQRIGDGFLNTRKKLLLQVPSVLVPEEVNYVLNPAHPAMQQVRVLHQRPMSWDSRLLHSI